MLLMVYVPLKPVPALQIRYYTFGSFHLSLCTSKV